MLAYEAPLEPPCNYWEEVGKPAFIERKIQEICADIVKRGNNSRFPEILDMLSEFLDENCEKYLPEISYEF